MFATNFVVADTHLRHIRGQENLKLFSQSKTIASGKSMTNCFCSTCGSLMYRISEMLPGHSILRTGTVDDFTLHETKLKPRFELYTKDRVGWLQGATGVAQVKGSAYPPKGQGPSGP
ncbi:GFA family protein [Aspergillus alliaceus]|uniref:GFA family protein n=1 Tax=Petromyces alliaceus TaxID=209559 RepID=UPI0012A73C60|nr:Mss4-like protein [Aspergillus alliaceus]KAB8230821.1 Mss4-like protein [Aspergillus alliaceus]